MTTSAKSEDGHTLVRISLSDPSNSAPSDPQAPQSPQPPEMPAAAAPHLQVVARYVRDQSFKSHTAPYLLAQAVKAQLELRTTAEPLPEAGHWRVSLQVRLTGSNADPSASQEPRFVAHCEQECVIYVAGLSDESLEHVLRVQVPGQLVGFARSLLASLTTDTGYGPMHIPPMTDASLSAIEHERLPFRGGAA